MWGRKDAAQTEPMLHSWKQRDFDVLLKSITGDFPRLSFVITGVNQGLQVNGDVFEPTPQQESYLARKDFIDGSAHLHGMVYGPRVHAEGVIETGKASEIDAGFVGYVNVECRQKPFVDFAVNVRTEAEVAKVTMAIQLGLLAKKPVELSLHLAPINDENEWVRQFAEKRFAPRLHVTRVSISTRVGQDHPEAMPIF